MGVSRVSIWVFDDDFTFMERKWLHTKENKDDNTRLYKESYPAYFDAINIKKFIAADDAATHPDTAEFKDTYLKSLQIYSMLDSPFIINGKHLGIICCENQYVARQWTPEDILFVQSLSDFISLTHKNHETHALLQQIQIQNIELVENRHEIDSMNEELNSINEKLELKVRERTEELEMQYKILTEYAFINSHQLRAPLSRILGLSQLVSKNLKDKTDIELINALISSTNELDLIINQISKLLYNGNKITRDDLRLILKNKLDQNENQ